MWQYMFSPFGGASTFNRIQVWEDFVSGDDLPRLFGVPIAERLGYDDN